MNALSNPLFALRAQRGGLHQKRYLIARTRGAGQARSLQDGISNAATECVIKRLPSIGDTPSHDGRRD